MPEAFLRGKAAAVAALAGTVLREAGGVCTADCVGACAAFCADGLFKAVIFRAESGAWLRVLFMDSIELRSMEPLEFIGIWIIWPPDRCFRISGFVID